MPNKDDRITAVVNELRRFLCILFTNESTFVPIVYAESRQLLCSSHVSRDVSKVGTLRTTQRRLVNVTHQFVGELLGALALGTRDASNRGTAAGSRAIRPCARRATT